MVDKSSYSGKDIKELPYPLNVQKRPQMYIGPVNDAGKLTSIREILNNSVDEFLAGYAKNIRVVRHDKESFSISDDGRGVPFDLQDSGINTMEVIFGRLHAGRNFAEKTVYSTGLNGVGASCVNALSSSFSVTSQRGNKIAKISFSNGIVEGKEGKDNASYKESRIEMSGTIVSFTFNNEFFDKGATTNIEDLIKLLKETASLNPGLKIEFVDEVDKTNSFIQVGSTKSFGDLLDQTTIEKSRLLPNVTFDSEIIKDTFVQVAFNFEATFEPAKIQSFCNVINTSEGGTHVTGFKRALSGKLVSHINDNKLVKEKVTTEDVYIGLNAVVSVMVFNPKYTSQTKQQLSNTEVNGHVVSYMNDKFQAWLDTNPKLVKILADKVAFNARVRMSQKRAIENTKKEITGSSLLNMSDPSKFVDCISNDNTMTELLIVEGQSAGGTVSDARNKNYQAIYKLRGKVLNTCGIAPHDARKNKEIDDLFSILKCGFGESFDASKCKFGRIIFLTDADQDGRHIEFLLLTAFASYWKGLIDEGRVYIAVSPLYRVTQPNKDPLYLKDASELNAFFLNQVAEVFDIRLEGKTSSPKESTRFVELAREYLKLMNSLSNEFNIDPHILENAFLYQFSEVDDLDKLKFPKSINVESNKESISFNGLLRLEDEELFVCLMNANKKRLTEGLRNAIEILSELHCYDISAKKGKDIEEPSRYNFFKALFAMINRSATVTRFKGLGESSAEDLWDSTLNPETRKLIQVTSIKDLEEVVKNYMHSSRVGFRKEVLQEVFSQLAEEDDTL